MKNSDIQKLTVYEFVRELSKENFDFIKDVYSSFELALEVYKKDSEESEKDDYLDIDYYFDTDRINWV